MDILRTLNGLKQALKKADRRTTKDRINTAHEEMEMTMGQVQIGYRLQECQIEL